ncbi:hypothetical protein BU16DRAFT_7204 [Lophium mytilinum]|uniref:Uncharacterized protein n=1 Tax=Lophium mytilinum TaxID=390894 RepID=A0A6A6RCW0_9PEZI|nr:hypothetical protein BU16DRAFT_7204 [Lophium mytilinum]
MSPALCCGSASARVLSSDCHQNWHWTPLARQGLKNLGPLWRTGAAIYLLCTHSQTGKRLDQSCFLAPSHLFHREALLSSGLSLPPLFHRRPCASPSASSRFIAHRTTSSYTSEPLCACIQLRYEINSSFWAFCILF